MSSSNSSTATSTGVSLGAVIAVVISWGIHHSIGWAIWHGILGWFYVIYHWIIGVY